MADTQSTTRDFSGLISGLLGVAFVVLKLTHVIDWSWWLVTLPFWGGLAVGLVLIAIGAGMVLLAKALGA